MNQVWKLTTLGEAFDVRDGTHDSPKYQDSGYPLVTSKNLKDGKITLNKIKYISEEDFKKINERSNVDINDVLFAMIGTIGNPVVVVSEPSFAIKNVALFKTNDKNDATFLKYFLDSSETINKMQSEAKGTTQKFVGLGYLRSFPITLPPLDEQKRIVKILDETFAAIDKAIENTERNLENAQEIFESQRSFLFKKQIKAGCIVKALGDVCDVIGGGTPSKSNQKFYEGDIPWATIRDMKNETLSSTEFCISRDAVKSSSTNIIPKDNVVIATRVGLGKVCWILNDTAINQDLRGVIPKSSDLNKKYLFRWFQSIAKLIEDEGTGATVKGVKLPFIKSLQLPIPSISEQQNITKKIDDLRAETYLLQSNYLKKILNLKELKQSILQKAFTGELTTDNKTKKRVA